MSDAREDFARLVADTYAVEARRGEWWPLTDAEQDRLDAYIEAHIEEYDGEEGETEEPHHED